MRHIDKDCLHGGAGKMLAEGLKTTDTDKDGTPVMRKTLCLPANVHAIATEVAFRKEVSLKQLIVYALTEMQNDGNKDCGIFDFHDSAHPTALLPRDVYMQARKTAHDRRIPERTYITEALTRYIRNHHQAGNQDIPGIRNL